MLTTAERDTLLTDLQRHYTSRVTILEQPIETTSTGTRLPVGAPVPLPMHEQIDALIVPVTQASGVEEQRQAGMTVESDLYSIRLRGLYPAIEPRMLARDQSGVSYDIVGVAHSTFRVITTLTARVVRPSAP